MKKLHAASILLIGTLGISSHGLAEIGVTDGCQQDIKDLRDEIDEDKDRYTLDSRTKANAQLTLAQTNRLNPVKCRKNIQDARAELRQGKRDKQDKD